MEKNIDYYQDQLIDMFYMSIENNIEKWSQDERNNKDFFSEFFGKYQLNLDTSRKKLYLKIGDRKNYIYLCTYKIWFIPIRFKMNKCANILKKYFDTKDDIIMMKDCLKIIGDTYVKEVRKEKLKSIK